MVRSPWYSAEKPGAQPSATCSFRRTAGSGQGGATGHSHSVAAECLGLLDILERTPPGRVHPLSWRPSHAPLPCFLQRLYPRKRRLRIFITPKRRQPKIPFPAWPKAAAWRPYDICACKQIVKKLPGAHCFRRL